MAWLTQAYTAVRTLANRPTADASESWISPHLMGHPLCCVRENPCQGLVLHLLASHPQTLSGQSNLSRPDGIIIDAYLTS
jgi:hypothetical protein